MDPKPKASSDMSEESILETQASHTRDIATLLQVSETNANSVSILTKTVDRGFEDMRTEYKEIRKDIGDVREANNPSLWPVVGAIAMLMVGMGGVAVAMSVLVLNPIGVALSSNLAAIDTNHAETRVMVSDAKDEIDDIEVYQVKNITALHERMNFILLKIDDLARHSGQWTKPDGTTATPAPHYQPFPRIE